MNPRTVASLRRIVRPKSYTCRLARNHNNFVLDGLVRWGMITRCDDGWVRPTGLGIVVASYLEAQELER